jgi:hypothetical protein
MATATPVPSAIEASPALLADLQAAVRSTRQLFAAAACSGWAAMTGQPIAVRDVQTDARFARDVAESTQYVPTGSSPCRSPTEEARRG